MKIYEILFMYTVYNLVFVGLTFFVKNKFFRNYVGANTIIIALGVLYAILRTKWSVFPNMYAHVAPRIHPRLLDVAFHFLPLLLVSIPTLGSPYYVYALATFTIWFMIMYVSGKLDVYRPISQHVAVEAWYFVVVSVVLSLGISILFP